MSSRVQEAKQKSKVHNLLEHLINADISIDEECINLYNLILELYCENSRMSYFVISEYIIAKYQEDETLPEILVDQLSSFSRYLKNETKFVHTDIEKVQRYVLKMSDHIKLEKLRQDNFRESHKAQVRRYISAQTRKIKESHDILNAKIERIDVSVVTILGVFTAITISVFGTLNIFGNLLSNLFMLSIPRALFSFAFSGFIIFNTIFLLLHTISKFTNTKLEKPRNPFRNNELEEDRKNRLRFVRDFSNFRSMYPLVFYYNMAMGITMLSSVLIWALNRHFVFLA